MRRYQKIEDFFINYTCKKKVWVIDRTVYEVWNRKVTSVILSDEYFVTGTGEENKSLQTYTRIINFLSKANANKDTTIIGIGGGTVGDIVGFVASTYLRGIKFINVPTTLLSMSDSCIGGKNGINTEFGKNMIGTIYEPSEIVIDLEWLDSVSEYHKTNGIAEIVKIAILKGGELFDILKNTSKLNSSNTRKLIELSNIYKEEFIKNDKKETGSGRILLNYGHTWGHAIELTDNLPHGYAVARGMVEEMKYSRYYLGFPSPPVYAIILNILKRWELFDAEKENDREKYEKKNLDKIFFYMSNDKKIRKLISIKNIGQPTIVEWNESDWRLLFSRYMKLKNNFTLKNNDTISTLVPSSKSMTNRALICAAMASNFNKSKFVLRNILISEDTELMLVALRQSNINFIKEGENVTFLPSEFRPQGNYYLGNSGTCVRFLLPLIAFFAKNEIMVDGSKEMRNRPIGPLVKSLIDAKCDIEDTEFLPLKIKPFYKSSQTLSCTVDGTLSSQFVSGLIMALSYFKSIERTVGLYQVKVVGQETSSGFINMTVNVLKNFGVNIVAQYNSYAIYELVPINIREYNIEGDSTSASYLIAMSFLTKRNLEIYNINNLSLQPDTKILKKMCKYFGNLVLDSILKFSPYKKISNTTNKVIDLDSSDTFLTWATLFVLNDFEIEITNIENQDWKECKRISNFIEQMNKLGNNIKKTKTGFINNASEYELENKKNY